jgi:hypothetical protein
VGATLRRGLHKNLKESTPKGYQKTLKELGFTTNPFPIEAPSSVNYWADFKELFDRLLDIHLQALLNRSSRMYVYFGELGSGKTHACRYFCNENTQNKLIKSIQSTGQAIKTKCIPAASPIPGKTGQLVKCVYLDILIQLLDMSKTGYEKLYELTKTPSQRACISALNGIAKIAKAQKQWSGSPVKLYENTEEYKFLTLRARSKKYGMLETTSDLSLVIEHLIKANFDTYDRTFIWIDECENLRESSSLERRLFSDFLRKIYDEIDSDLTIILIFSLSSYTDVQKLLMPAIWSRIQKEETQEGTIEFTLLKNDGDLNDYLTDCLKAVTSKDLGEIIEEGAIQRIIAEIKQESSNLGISPRDVNRKMQTVLTRSYHLWTREGKGKAKFKITANLVASLSDKRQQLLEELRKELLGGTA